MDERMFELAQEREEKERQAGIADVLRTSGDSPVIIDGTPCCCDCEEPIPKARLKACPSAARCIDCQSQHDQRQAQFARKR